MNDKANQFAAFKDWYDAQWLGDREHGQVVPNVGDARFAEYTEGYTVALGAWIEATAAEREACAKVCDGLTHALDNSGSPYWRPADAAQCARSIRAR